MKIFLQGHVYIFVIFVTYKHRHKNKGREKVCSRATDMSCDGVLKLFHS